MKAAGLNFVSCHRLPERSFFFRGKQFPLCARCTGIYLGYISFPFFFFGLLSIPLLWTIALILPTLIDGTTQAYFGRESKNSIRVTTGFLSGIGQMSLVDIVCRSSAVFILSLF